MTASGTETRIGRHRLERTLASSDVISTYEAVHDQHGLVRLRVLEMEFTPSEGAMHQLASDASLASGPTLSEHTGVRDWSVEDPLHVSTLVPAGVPLAELVDLLPEGRLQPPVVAALGVELSQVLEVAHGHGLVHGALSPRNVHLSPNGQPRITDFAIGRFVTSLIGEHSYLLDELVRGLAPEQVVSHEVIGPATDVFALGVLLYRLVTGCEPFEASSALGVSLRLSMAEAQPVLERGVSIDEDLAEVIMSMLRTSPSARLTLSEVCARLRSVAAPSHSWRAEISRWVSGRDSAEHGSAEPGSAEHDSINPFELVGDTSISASQPCAPMNPSGIEPSGAEDFDSHDPFRACSAGGATTQYGDLDQHPTRIEQVCVDHFEPTTAPYVDSSSAELTFDAVPKTVVLTAPTRRVSRRTRSMSAAETPASPEAIVHVGREPFGALFIGAWGFAAFVIGLIVALGVYAAAVS